MGQRNFGRRFLVAYCACLLAALGLLLYPLYVIRPFRAQGPRELSMALAAIRYRPPILALCVAAALAALVWYWRREPRRARRLASAAGILAVAAAAWLSRVNVYELMFHPSGEPTFSTAAGAKLDGREKVIAVRLGGAARAYAVRSMSYHHVVNDLLDGEPIVATY